MNKHGNTRWNFRGYRSFWVFAVFAVVVISMSFSTIFAPKTAAVTSVPTKMNFQGRLTNSSGNVLADGTYNMRLKLYSSATGGTALWSEDRLVSASNGVTLQNGLFSIRMGDVNSLPASLFNNQTYSTLYLEVELPTPATATSSSPSWSEGAMTPRNQLATSAYAFNSDSLDGLDSSDFAQVGSSNTFTGSSNTFKPSSNSTSSFSIQDSSGTNLLAADSSNKNIIVGSTTANTNPIFLAVNNYSGSSDPSGGVNGSIYYNSSLGKLRCYEAGSWQNCSSSPQSSASTASQSVTAGTDTYLTGSAINMPGGGLQGPTGTNQDGSQLSWRIFISKTAAGTAASTFTIRFGTGGSTSDTARCTAFSTGTATAAVDSAVVYLSVYATAGGSGTTLNCSGTMTHNQATTGFSTAPTIVQSFSSQTAFATNTAGTKAGISLNAGSGSTITVNKVESSAINM